MGKSFLISCYNKYADMSTQEFINRLRVVKGLFVTILNLIDFYPADIVSNSLLSSVNMRFQTQNMKDENKIF